jgi:hypothetical protein
VSFLQWTFLFGAIAVVGPIVAHLLAKPRFRRVPFTMLQFLRTGRQESHARRKLRDLLILLLRCTIIVLMAVLFARPVLHVKAAPQKHRSIHYLALDDSMSMAYQDGGESLFERMIETAVEHVRRAPDDAAFSICGLASGRAVHGLSRNQAVMEIKRLAVVPKSAQLTDFLSTLRQAGRTAPAGDRLHAAIFSDFTPGVLRQFEQLHEPAVVDELEYEKVALAKPINNAAIADVRAVDMSDNKLDIDIVITNYGDTAQQRDVTVKAPDLKPVSTKVDLAPHERRVVRVQMDLGLSIHRPNQVCLPVEVALGPKDGLMEDDVFRLAVCIPRGTSANILIVHQADETFLFETAIQTLARQGPTKGLSLKRVKEGRLTPQDVDWANVVVFSSPPGELSCPLTAFKSHLADGGRLVFFATQAGNRQIAERLVREGLLPAVPEKWVQQTMYPEPQPRAGGCPAFSDRTVKSILNYRFDGIALKGYWLCRTPSDAECVWRLTNGAGFLYHRALDRGSLILVNTSIDDSLGLLAKSRAWVAFCRFLTGETDAIRQLSLGTEDRPAVTVPDSMRVAAQTLVGVENCDGSRTRAVCDGTRLLLPAPAGVGWMKTLNEPTLYAAVNLPAGETDVSRPTDETVAAAMKRAFLTGASREQAPVPAGVKSQDKPLWRVFAWAVVLLLLLEPALTNRLKR